MRMHEREFVNLIGREIFEENVEKAETDFS